MLRDIHTSGLRLVSYCQSLNDEKFTERNSTMKSLDITFSYSSRRIVMDPLSSNETKPSSIAYVNSIFD